MTGVGALTKFRLTGRPNRRAAVVSAATLLSALLLMGGVSGCSDEPGGKTTGNKQCSYTSGGSLGIDRLGQIQLQDAAGKELTSGTAVSISAAGLTAGEAASAEVILRNAAQLASAHELLVTAVSLDYTMPSGGDDGATPAFQCLAAGSDGQPLQGSDGQPLPCSAHDFGSIVPLGFDENCTSRPAANQARFLIRLTRPKDGLGRQATLRLTVQRDADGKAKETLEVPFVAQAGTPRINLSPGKLDFGVVPAGASNTVPVQIVNLGDDQLVVTGFEIGIGTQGTFEGKLDDLVIEGGKPVQLSAPVLVGPQESKTVQVKWTAAAETAMAGEFVALSNDTTKPRAKVNLLGNTNVPCLTASPDTLLDIGVIYVGSTGSKAVNLKSCGNAVAEAWDFAISDDSAGVFALDTAAFVGGMPTKEAPLTLAANKSSKVPVKCTPPSDNGGVPFTAKLTFANNTTAGAKTIDLKCFGNAASCPTAYIELPDGEEVLPQSEVTLDGSNSFAKAGSVVEWKWKLTKVPEGAVGVGFYPSDKDKKPKLGVKTEGDFGSNVTLNVAGEYCVSLEVKDSSGVWSCVAAESCIAVIPDAAIHVELTWTTEGDPDPTDTGEGAGADLDLHFAHENATLAKICATPGQTGCSYDQDKDGLADPWFHEPYDSYWFNKYPDWGAIGSGDDNATLDLDDIDGFGPENVNLRVPEAVDYWVGAHYWEDNSFGESVATARLYILGVLKATYVQKMQPCDFWWIRKIEWPSGDLLDVPMANLGPPSSGKVMAKYKSALAASLNGKCKFN